MADRLDYFFRQTVTEAELDEGFDKMEAADQKLMTDQVLTGIFIGGQVAERFPTPDLTVDVAGPFNAYDQQGRRLFFSPLQNVDVSQDENAVPTAVGSPGNSKKLTIFAQFDRLLSDPRLDGNNNTVFFQRAESFKLNVVQSAEAVSPVLPAPRPDQLILADIDLAFGATQIFNGDIDSSRRADAFNLTGSPNAIRVGRVKDALQAMLNILNGGIGYGGGPAWADGTPNPASTVESQLDKIVSDLAGGAGAAKINGVNITEGGDPIVDLSTLQVALQDLAEGKHAGIDYFFGAEAIIPADAWTYSETLVGWTTTVNGDDAYGWFAMQGAHKVFEVAVFVVGAAASNVTARLRTFNMATGSLGAVLDTKVSSTGGAETLTFAFTPFTISTPTVVFIEFEALGGGAGSRFLRGGRVKARRLT